MNAKIDRWGLAGLFLTAIVSPCCFPLFGVLLASLGLGSFELFGGWTMWIFQGFVLLSLLGTGLSYRQHRNPYPLLVAILAAVLIFYSYHFIDDERWTYGLYTGMCGLMLSAWLNYRKRKKQQQPELVSTLVCPNCGHRETLQMPEDACTYFHTCAACATRYKPLPGDCCVFCSYGTVPCPPVQQNGKCCV